MNFDLQMNENFSGMHNGINIGDGRQAIDLVVNTPLEILHPCRAVLGQVLGALPVSASFSGTPWEAISNGSSDCVFSPV